MVIQALFALLFISYIILTLVSWKMDGKFSFIKVFKVWWNITMIKGAGAGELYDGDTFYEHCVYWSISIPLGLLILIGFGSLVT